MIGVKQLRRFGLNKSESPFENHAVFLLLLTSQRSRVVCTSTWFRNNLTDDKPTVAYACILQSLH